MSAERTVAEIFRETVDAVPVSAPPPSAIRARAGSGAQRRGRGWAPVLAAAAVVGLAGLTVVVPTVAQRPAATPGAERPRTVLPTEIAGLSLLTATVSDAPPGRAVALFHQGSFGMTIGFSQVVVLGADGKTYRRLDLAEERGATGDDNEWHAAEALLSPDGLKVAVTDSVRATTTVDVVDLTTGRPLSIALPSASAVRPLAWTPDGERLLVTRQEPAGTDGFRPEVKLSVVDVLRPSVRDLPVRDRTGDGALWRATVAADGRTAVVSDGAIGGVLRSIHLDSGEVERELVLDEGQDLVDANAIAPDGRYVAVAERAPGDLRVRFLDTSNGLVRPVPIYLSDSSRFLGWSTSRAFLVAEEGGRGLILSVPVQGGNPTTLSRFAGGGLQRVSGLQLALDGPGRLVTADVGGPDRGPWPWWFRITLGAVVLLVLGLVGRRWRRRRAG